MATLQVRSIDDGLYRALSKRAKMENRSISQEVIAIIKDFLSHTHKNHRNATNTFLKLAGSWQDPRDANEIADEIRGSRHTKRFKEIL